MPPIPGAKEFVRDGGLGFAGVASLLAVVIGHASGGTKTAKNVFELYRTQQALVDARGQGTGVEQAANILSQAGQVAFIAPNTSVPGSNGPVRVYNVTPGTNSAITRSGGTSGPAISVSGAPTGVYTMRVEIQTGGALGTATFRWWRDGATYEGTGVLTAGSVTLGDTGITVTFPAGTYVTAEVYTWTTTVTGGTITVSGTAAMDAMVRVEMLTGGALGTATFKYSCDAYYGDTASERTYSEPLTVPAGGVFAVPGIGITLTFSSTFVAGDAYTTEVEAPSFNATDLANAFGALTTENTPWRFVSLGLSRANGDSAAHAVIAAALQAQLTVLQNSSRYRAGMVAADQGENTTVQIITAFASTVTPRCLVAAGRVKRVTTKPFAGFGAPVTHGVDVIAARAAISLPSTDLKRVNSGPLVEVRKLFHDEWKTPSGLDDAKITTLRTWDGSDGLEGFFVTQGRIKSAASSDFRLWPHRINMDIACEVAHSASVRFIGRGLRTNVSEEEGTIGALVSTDIASMELEVQSVLEAALIKPLNAEGRKGHVQRIIYVIDPEWDYARTGVVVATVGIVPLFYTDNVETTLGYQVELTTRLGFSLAA